MKPTSATPQRVVLETSLKPFAGQNPTALRAACLQLWDNWKPLCAGVDEVAVMLWVGSGDEILLWHSNWSAPMPYADSIGFCNYDEPGAYPPGNAHYSNNRAVPYRPNPPTLRYRDLRNIIAALRATAGRPILIGATFDPGPEFATSPFRYKEHPELLTPGNAEKNPHMMHFITHQATLKDGMPFGTFLGRQTKSLAKAVGFDFIWFSNGWGFTHFPWSAWGEVFRAGGFHLDEAGRQRERTNKFWRDFTSECRLPIEVRGTNFTVGMDLVSDGCSHIDLWKIGGLKRPPVNPPWGSRALGLEMVSYLSRLAATPTNSLPFRYYLNDPWFVVNPLLDYYNHELFDIYVPMSASRLNARGGVDAPTALSVLTIDNEKGELRPADAREVTPHLHRAFAERADTAGPVVWVYPFHEYDNVLKQSPDRLPRLLMHDWFMCQAVNAGLPVNTVCSLQRFTALKKKLPDAIYIAPTMDCGALLDSGKNVLLYGPLDDAPPAVRTALGVTLDEPLEGDFDVELNLATDNFTREPQRPAGEDPNMAAVGLLDLTKHEGGPRRLRHRALNSGGGIREVATDSVRIAVTQNGQRRAYAIVRGRVAWIRGTVGWDPAINALEPVVDPAWRFHKCDDWPRRLLAEFGLDIRQDRLDENVRPANVFIKRYRGAWWFVGHKPNTTAKFWVKTADGAPLYAECETPIVNGYAGETFGKTFVNEVRAFVKMRDGVVQVKELPVPIGQRRHFCLAGLEGATVTLYPEPKAQLRLLRKITDKDTVPFTPGANGAVIVHDYTGNLQVQW